MSKTADKDWIFHFSTQMTKLPYERLPFTLEHSLERGATCHAEHEKVA